MTKYKKPVIVIHWLSALFIIIMMASGMIGNKIDQDSILRLRLIKLHGTIGLVVLVLTAIRLVLLFTTEKPKKLEMPKWREQAFSWNHWLLYIVLITLLTSGIAMLLTSGIGLNPANISPTAIKDSLPRNVHGLLAKLFLALFIMHVGGALHYQFTEGKTLNRMCARGETECIES